MGQARGPQPLAIAFLAAAWLLSNLAAGDYAIERHTVEGGGVINAVGGAYSLSGTAGQATVGPLTGGGYTLVGGFWPGFDPGDCDGDHDVDLEDWVAFETCFTGPGVAVTAECQCHDLNGDETINLEDFMLFATHYTGK